MTHKSEITGQAKFANPKHNYHAAHFSDSNRGYWCGCMKTILIGKRRKYAEVLSRHVHDKRGKRPSPHLNQWHFNRAKP